jgi:hypothetical protein
MSAGSGERLSGEFIDGPISRVDSKILFAYS